MSADVGRSVAHEGVGAEMCVTLMENDAVAGKELKKGSHRAIWMELGCLVREFVWSECMVVFLSEL